MQFQIFLAAFFVAIAAANVARVPVPVEARVSLDIFRLEIYANGPQVVSTPSRCT